MFFYAMFALAIWLNPQRRVVVVSLMLALLVAVGVAVGLPAHEQQTVAHPRVLEFVSGLWLATSFLRGWPDSKLGARLLLGAGVIWMAATVVIEQRGLPQPMLMLVAWRCHDLRWFGPAGADGATAEHPHPEGFGRRLLLDLLDPVLCARCCSPVRTRSSRPDGGGVRGHGRHRFWARDTLHRRAPGRGNFAARNTMGWDGVAGCFNIIR